jgi:hypothetical protein
VTKILGSGFSLDEEKYRAYSPMFLAPTLALNYERSFAAIAAVVIHVILFHRNEIWHRYKASRDQAADIHLLLMKKNIERLPIDGIQHRS